MLKVFGGWVERYFSDEEALLLVVLLVVSMVVVLTLGAMLAPVFAGMVIAFLMQGIVTQLKRWGIGHNLAVTLVFLAFIGALAALCLVVLPQIWKQAVNLFNELPRMLRQGQDLVMLLPERYPELVSASQLQDWLDQVTTELGNLGQLVLSFSLNSIGNLVLLLVYLVLVPILVFFFLKDGALIMRWMTAFLPEKRRLLSQVGREMDTQIANYVRGKVIEILVVGAVSYVTFILFGLNYAALLALMVGFSVVIPYIGAAVVTVPVALIAYFQWGWSDSFIWVLVAYGVIQALDGNVLVPLLFSEAVNLHPVAIIGAVLVFGGLWGFWGIFFAIPLGTLIKAVLNAWPRGSDLAPSPQGESGDNAQPG